MTNRCCMCQIDISDHPGSDFCSIDCAIDFANEGGEE